MGIATSSGNWIEQLLERLSSDDPDLRFRAGIVLGVGAMQVLFFALVSVTDLTWGTPLVGVICLFGAIAVALILVNLIRGGSVSRTATWFIVVLYGISAVLNLGSAGQTLGVNIALPSLVLVGALVLSLRGAALLLFAVVAQLVMVADMDFRGVIGPLRLDPEWVHLSIYRVPVLISLSTAFIGLLVQRGMQRYRTELARTQQDLADNEKQLREIIEYSRSMICTHSIEGDLLSVNPAAAQALEYDVGDLIGRNIRELVTEERKPHVADYLARIQTHGAEASAIHLNSRSGEPRIWEYKNRLCTSINGEPYILVNATDMTERRLLEEKLREQNIRDPLTGCFNRRYLSLLESRFNADQTWGCVIVDLDNFKQVNDNHGHHRGDEMLVEIGNFLNRYAGQCDAVIRMGGDEFLLLLTERGTEAESIAQRIRSAAETDAPCEISIGSAMRRVDETLPQMIERADLELYGYRNEGRRLDSIV